MNRLLAGALLFVLCFAVYDAFAGSQDGNVVLIPPTCSVASGTQTWAYEDYLGVVVTNGAGVATSSTSTPATILVWRCFPTQAACGASQNSAAKPSMQNFTLGVGASSVGSLQVGRIALGCHTETSN